MASHSRSDNLDRHGTSAPAGRVDDYLAALGRLLERHGLEAQRRSVRVGDTGRSAQVLESGEGPPLLLVIGGGVPAGFWVPLMARLPGHRVHAIELPGFGLTDPAIYRPGTVRRTAVAHLAGILDSLGTGPAPFVTQSMGSQWTTWLAAEQPHRVRRQVMVACPAFFLDTSAILQFRLASVPGLGPLLLSAQRPSTKNAAATLRMVGEDPTGLDELRDLMLATQRLPAYTPSLVALMRSVMSWTRPRPEIITTADQLRAVQHPVRLIWGDHDPFGSVASGRQIAGLLPDADLHVVDGGHGPWFHRTAEVARLTADFLEA